MPTTLSKAAIACLVEIERKGKMTTGEINAFQRSRKDGRTESGVHKMAANLAKRGYLVRAGYELSHDRMCTVWQRTSKQPFGDDSDADLMPSQSILPHTARIKVPKGVARWVFDWRGPMETGGG